MVFSYYTTTYLILHTQKFFCWNHVLLCQKKSYACLVESFMMCILVASYTRMRTFYEFPTLRVQSSSINEASKRASFLLTYNKTNLVAVAWAFLLNRNEAHLWDLSIPRKMNHTNYNYTPLFRNAIPLNWISRSAYKY